MGLAEKDEERFWGLVEGVQRLLEDWDGLDDVRDRLRDALREVGVRPRA